MTTYARFVGVLLVILLVICLLLAVVLWQPVAVLRRLGNRTGVFRCKVRLTSGAVPQLSPRRPLRVCQAEWKP